ncbi:MAG: peptide chain release factor 2 [Acidobacteria bacterium]|nr:peptide chain release factor 2 [Acidobacteriota bacterium]
MILEEVKSALEETRSRIHDIRGYLDIDHCLEEVTRLEELSANPDFWNDQQQAQEILKKTRRLQEKVELVNSLQGMVEDLGALVELAEEGENVVQETTDLLSDLTQRLQEAEIRTILSGENDIRNAFVTIHPGAGGTESQDWAEMLLRMYLRYCEKKEFRTEMVDFQPGDEAGVKSATFLAQGEYAYGFLKAEIGVHRLVRISPFDANSRRHTSFASVFVYPEIDDEVEIEVDDKDIRVDTFCASGPGGQGVNTTYSAVRITHFPSGIVVQCQNERSQLRNREVAMKVLKARLYELELEKKQAEQRAQEDAKKEIGWGSQIRSYVLHPYRMVKDVRTREETGNVDAVLDGDLDDFIKAYLIQYKKKFH